VTIPLGQPEDLRQPHAGPAQLRVSVVQSGSGWREVAVPEQKPTSTKKKQAPSPKKKTDTEE
jgi:hypothetical protein